MARTTTTVASVAGRQSPRQTDPHLTAQLQAPGAPWPLGLLCPFLPPLPTLPLLRLIPSSSLLFSCSAALPVPSPPRPPISCLYSHASPPGLWLLLSGFTFRFFLFGTGFLLQTHTQRHDRSTTSRAAGGRPYACAGPPERILRSSRRYRPGSHHIRHLQIPGQRCPRPTWHI